MLEPLIAFGLFGNIVQLVQFSKELNLEAHEIHHTGSSRSQTELRHLVCNVFDQIEEIKVLFTDRLEREKKELEREKKEFEREKKDINKSSNQMLHGLIDSCDEIRKNFVKCMGTEPSSLPVSKWKSIRKTVVLMLKRHSVEDYVRRLERLRDELSFYVIISIRSEIQKNHEQVIQQLSGLREVDQKIVDSTGDNTEDAMQSLPSNMKEDVQDPVGHTINRTEDSTQDFYPETNVV